MLARRVRSQAHPRTGAAVLEFAVVLPVLLAFVLGIIEIGRLVMVAQIATNASREGARYAVQGHADTATVETYVRSYLSAAGVANAATGPNSAVSMTIEALNGSNWTAVSEPATVASGTPMRVTVSVNFNSQSWLPSRFFVGNYTQVPGISVMRRE